MHHLRTTATNHEQYLHLMELARKEDPKDHQICFWLGRGKTRGQSSMSVGSELMQRYLALPSSTWTEERSEAMRHLARMQADHRMVWLRKSADGGTAPAGDLARFGRGVPRKADWLNLFWACTNGIEKTHRTGSYLDDPRCWGFRLSIWLRSAPGIST